MTEWKEYKLGEVIKTNVESIGKDYPYSKILYLDTGSITRNNIDQYQEFELDKAPSRAKRLVKQDDIIYSSVRPNQLHYGYITNPANNLVVSTGFVTITCNKAYIEPKFLYYYLTQENITEYLHSVAEASTSAYPSLKASDIESLYIELPPLPEQIRIASILSSLDDKIDLLHRENKTLEAMAETLFRQWFIEEAKEDWEEKPLSFYGKIICGKTPPKKENKYFGGEIPFIKIPDMHNKTFVFTTEDTLTIDGKLYQLNKTLPPFSIVVSCIATVGLVVLNAKESQTNQQINTIIPYKEEYRYYLYLKIKNMYEELNAMASGGTATLNLNTSDFSKIEVLYPPINILNEFHFKVRPLFDKIYNNQEQIQTLIQQRDGFLPKLMSGEVKI